MNTPSMRGKRERSCEGKNPGCGKLTSKNPLHRVRVPSQTSYLANWSPRVTRGKRQIGGGVHLYPAASYEYLLVGLHREGRKDSKEGESGKSGKQTLIVPLILPFTYRPPPGESWIDSFGFLRCPYIPSGSHWAKGQESRRNRERTTRRPGERKDPQKVHTWWE